MLTPIEKNKRKCQLRDGVPEEQMQLRVVDYARVSTTKQSQKSSMLNQLETYRELIDNNPNWTYIATYSDEGVTGTRVDIRGGFQKMMQDARENRFDLILVKSVSRFGRNAADALNAIQELSGLGVMVKFYAEGINTLNEQNKVFLTMYTAMAEAESRNASARVKSTLERGIQKGRVYGNDQMLGYRKKDCKLAIEPEEAQIVRLIFHLYVYGNMGTRKIAKELERRGLQKKNGKPVSVKNVKDALVNPKYKGWYCGRKTLKDTTTHKRFSLEQKDWVMYPDPKIPAIVSEEVWDMAEKIRYSRLRNYQKTVKKPFHNGNYTYSGLIGYMPHGDKHYVHAWCSSRGERKEAWQDRYATGAARGPTVYTEELDSVIVLLLQQLLGENSCLEQTLLELYQKVLRVSDLHDEDTILQREENNTRTAIEKLFELYTASAITMEEFKQRKIEQEQRLAQIQKKRSTLQDKKQDEKQKQQYMEQIQHSIRQILQQKKPSRSLVEKIVQQIWIVPGSTTTRLQLQIVLKLNLGVRMFHIDRKHKLIVNGE